MTPEVSVKDGQRQGRLAPERAVRTNQSGTRRPRVQPNAPPRSPTPPTMLLRGARRRTRTRRASTSASPPHTTTTPAVGSSSPRSSSSGPCSTPSNPIAKSARSQGNSISSPTGVINVGRFRRGRGGPPRAPSTGRGRSRHRGTVAPQTSYRRTPPAACAANVRNTTIGHAGHGADVASRSSGSAGW